MLQECILNQFQEFVVKEESIKAVALIGSMVSNDYNLFSDLDLAVFGELHLVLTCLEGFSKLLRPQPLMQLHIHPNKYHVYLGNPLIKIDYTVFDNPSDTDFQRFYKESHIAHPENAALYDPNNLLSTGISKFSNDRVFDLNFEFQDTGKKFCNYLESSSYYHSRGDTYRAYFLYNLALHQLAKLLYLEGGGRFHLYNPPLLFSYLEQSDIDRLRVLTGSLVPMDVKNRNRELYDYFEEVIDRINKNCDMNFPIEKYRRFFETFWFRDFIYNFREVSFTTHPSENGISNLLFRSSDLSLYQNRKELWQLLKEKKIQTIIDLRSKSEIDKSPYSAEMKNQFRIISIPFELNFPNPNRSIFNGYNPLEKFYIHLIYDMKEEMRRIIQLLIDESTGPVLIHCLAGRDRTGFVVAMIQLFLGVQDKYIIREYLTSGESPKEALIHLILSKISELGGREAYASYLGLKSSDLQKIHKHFIRKMRDEND